MKKENNKVGRPRIIQTPEVLMDLFLEFKDSNDKLLTIEGFMMFLKFDKKKIKNLTYWYDLNEEFSKTKKEIEMIMFERFQNLSINKDNATSFLIFYGKNKFGMSDRIENQNVNINKEVNLSNEEMEKLLNE